MWLAEPTICIPDVTTSTMFDSAAKDQPTAEVLTYRIMFLNSRHLAR